MIVTKFHEKRLTIDREINEKHAILVDFGYNLILPLTYVNPSLSRLFYKYLLDLAWAYHRRYFFIVSYRP